MSMYNCAVCDTPRCECVLEDLHRYREDLRDLAEKYVKLEKENKELREELDETQRRKARTK